jgi:hypothetical protein
MLSIPRGWPGPVARNRAPGHLADCASGNIRRRVIGQRQCFAFGNGGSGPAGERIKGGGSHTLRCLRIRLALRRIS